MEKKTSGRLIVPGKANGTDLKKSQGTYHNSKSNIEKTTDNDLGKTDMQCGA
jgi:hypothetical protein